MWWLGSGLSLLFGTLSVSGTQISLEDLGQIAFTNQCEIDFAFITLVLDSEASPGELSTFMSHGFLRVAFEATCEHDETIIVWNEAFHPDDIEFGRCSWIIPNKEWIAQHSQIVGFNSRIYWLDLDADQLIWIRDVFKLNGNLEVQVVEKWDGGNRLWHNSRRLLRRSNLKGYEFLVASADFIPYQVLSNDSRTNIDGLVANLLDDLGQVLNFTYSLTPENENRYGTYLPNKTWTGVMGQIVNGKVDFGAVVATANYQRQQVMDFIPAHVPFVDALVFWKSENSVSGYSFLGMFETAVWICVGSVFTLTFVTTAIYALIGPDSTQNPGDTLSGIVGTIVNQGAPILPKDVAGRTLFITGLILGWISVVVFSARLVSHLSTKTPLIKVESLNDMEGLNYDLFIPGDGTDFTQFSEAPEGTVKYRLWRDKISSDPKFYPQDSILISSFASYANPISALYYNQLAVRYWIAENRAIGCRFMEAKLFQSNFGHIPVKMGFEFKELFEYHINVMKQSGLIDKLLRIWTENKDIDPKFVCPEPDVELFAMELTHVVAFFLILVFGIVIALGVLLCEVSNYCLKATK